MKTKTKVIVLLAILGFVLISGCVEEKQETPEEFCIKTGTGEKLSLTEAKQIALASECGEQGTLKDTHMCNADTGTWWIDLDPYTEREGCNPACVISVVTKQAEINWRCTGAIEPPPVQEGLTTEECADADGRVVNTADGFTCDENEISIGEVGGFAYLHLCCVPFPESKKLTIEEAMEIAQNSECTEKGDLTEEYVYNPNSKTWWIDLDMKEEFEKEYCRPACVVYEFTKTAEINWRCMGALPPVE